jgi:hypothetical protein
MEQPSGHIPVSGRQAGRQAWMWWHRVGMPARLGPRPIAEHRSPDPLSAFADGADDRALSLYQR